MVLGPDGGTTRHPWPPRIGVTCVLKPCGGTTM
jgi:hypothetical protein